jgi:hypothetical protein
MIAADQDFLNDVFHLQIFKLPDFQIISAAKLTILSSSEV